MRKYSSLNKAASIAVCFGILLSNTAFAFDNNHVGKSVSGSDGAIQRTGVARDVELQTDGALRGKVFTSDQRPVENAQIELKFQGTTVARTTTGSDGDFLITGVRGGAHEIAVGSMSSPVRLWKNGTAPSGAVDGFVIAAREEIVRGQAYEHYYDPYYDNYNQPSSGFGLMDVVALAVIGAAATGVAIAIHEHNEDPPAQVASP
jgi:Carboxypeptidase regulatory-like domain